MNSMRGYFTPGRVARLFRYTVRHWGRSRIAGRDGVGCPCCGREVFAPPPPADRPRHSGDADQPLCDVLAEHLRTECPRAGEASYLLGDTVHPEDMIR